MALANIKVEEWIKRPVSRDEWKAFNKATSKILSAVYIDNGLTEPYEDTKEIKELLCEAIMAAAFRDTQYPISLLEREVILKVIYQKVAGIPFQGSYATIFGSSPDLSPAKAKRMIMRDTKLNYAEEAQLLEDLNIRAKNRGQYV
jgi:hypothetical protein